MNWTDERVELLKKLWNEGLSASQIAAQLGGVSRNAVIGKVHRLKLSGRGKTTTAAPRSKKVNTAAPAPRAVPSQNNNRPQAATTTIRTATITKTVGATALQMEYVADAVSETVLRPQSDVVVPISRRLSLLQLSERTCKWPIGDPLNEDFHFCGSESGESSPYCSYHSRLAFQPTAERRRAR
ncbi:GcrA cell cycle regulator [Falsochrobactrum shanghaiense]|uniref:GcrA cell cycle regulator n=1 Tax=Falsochrobactrum shanghaiense TaxID=2201899 RepID=A0A316JDA0_9HYPH|nr:GcrA family cell cycle regulator [Falsochrobactrum shanghaiense]PWL19221.1 GcrA cell cycle regulator [Falsochrobactrum shanghaiense]